MLILSVLMGSAMAADPLTSAEKLRKQSQQEAVESQQHIDTASEQTRALLEEYRNIVQQAETSKSYNDHLGSLVNGQQERLDSIQQQMLNAQRTQQEIAPLLARMVEVFGELIRLDLPFLPEERNLRLQHLKELVNKSDVPLPEKYRRIMEAFQVEMEYGRNIEAYTGEFRRDGDSRTVEFLRIGRIALLYRTFDGKTSGYWDKQNKKWLVLPSAYNEAIEKGFKIARKEAPPEFVRVPVRVPETGQ